MTESEIYTYLLKSSILNSKETSWLVKEGYLGEYDPSYITKKAEAFIAEFEGKYIDQVTGYLKLNGSITFEKLRDIVPIDSGAFEVFVKRLIKKHRLMVKKPGNIFVLRKDKR